MKPIPCTERMPDNDRYVLIYSPSYFGPDKWHPAAWMGDDNKDGVGDWNWTIDAVPFSTAEIGATHWIEMPPRP